MALERVDYFRIRCDGPGPAGKGCRIPSTPQPTTKEAEKHATDRESWRLMDDGGLWCICGEHPISETCPDCLATGCEACLDGHVCGNLAE